MAKFTVITSNLSISNSNNHGNINDKNGGKIMNTILSTASNFREIAQQFFDLFNSKKSATKASETLYLNSNSGIINLRKLRTKRAASGGAKTIEEFDLAACFDKSEIIATKAKKTRVSRSYCNNINKEKWQYDQERENKEDCRSKNNHQHQRQINQLRGK